MSNEILTSGAVHFLQKQFLNRVPAKSLSFSECLANVGDDSCATAKQDLLLNLTVGNKLVKEYPLKREYQLSFLKALISWLENNELEVTDSVYTSYCNLLTPTSEDNEGTHFRHYLLDSTNTLVIKESVSLISQGTTGLCSWQAAQALAEWCLVHQDLLQDKTVLELGSGVGLTGLVVSLCCRPKSYLFSDCHPAVLDLLESNVRLNIGLANKLTTEVTSEDIGQKQTISCDTLFTDRVNNTEIKILRLPWEEVNENLVVSDVGPDIILAADVVYDSSVSPILVQTLKHFLLSRRSSECTVLLACTVRNPETLQNFFDLLIKEIKTAHVTEEDIAVPNIFLYPADSIIKIYKICTHQ